MILIIEADFIFNNSTGTVVKKRFQRYRYRKLFFKPQSRLYLCTQAGTQAGAQSGARAETQPITTTSNTKAKTGARAGTGTGTGTSPAPCK
jgi:hypothetical protein